MDALITAASRALSAGDPLRALKRIALRDDAPALALRGIAMAQLGDLPRARALLQRARKVFLPNEALARARCLVAEADVAFAARELGWSPAALDAARSTLESHGDRVNAMHARHLAIRRLLLIGRLDDAERALQSMRAADLTPAAQTMQALIVAGIQMRRLRATAARSALADAAQAARAAGIPALLAEVRQAQALLDAPLAYLRTGGAQYASSLAQVEALLASDALVVDACRYAVSCRGRTVALATRPVLFALILALGQAWPRDVPRDALIGSAFATRWIDATHRSRLRVEIGRLRRLLKPMADLHATPRGYVLALRGTIDVAVLSRMKDEKHAALLALLADGEAWSSTSLSLALGTSQRSVQRALDALAAAGRVQYVGHGRARRWVTPPVPGFATALLLPAPLPSD